MGRVNMLRRALLLSAASAALLGCSAQGQNEQGPPAGPEPLAPAASLTDAFDVALYQAIAAAPGNHFISPFSVASAFTLVYPGARGQTAAELAAMFGFDPSPATQAMRTRALAQALTANTGGSAFTLANAAWVERTMALRAEYARMIEEELAATIEQVDFIANPAAALRRINAWSAQATHDRIPEILTTPDPSRRLVLTNAVYFKGKWSDPSSPDATRDGDFHTATGLAQPARLMRHMTHARYFEGEGFQAAEFDYDDGAFALAVFLPRARAGLDAFERNLTGAHLDAWLQSLADAPRARLDVTLPKIRLNANYELAPQLRALGLRTSFGDGADFSAITDHTSLGISAVIHKTFLAIDEEGTEAAAVTALDMVATAMRAPPPAPPIEFKADHPFFVVLRQKQTRTRLFLGRIAAIA